MTHLATKNFARTWQISTVLFVEYGISRKREKDQPNKGAGESSSNNRLSVHLGTCASRGGNRWHALSTKVEGRKSLCHGRVDGEFPRLVKRWEVLHMLDANTKAMVLEALMDEYKSRAFYRLVLNTFGEIRPFSNIVNAEETHARALELLCGHFGIPLPKDDWEGKLAPPSSVLEACRAGIQGEHDNISMYDRFLRQTKVPEVLTLFQRLQAASRQHHLPAFERCAARGGQTGRRAMSLGRVRAGRPGRHGRQDENKPGPHHL